MNETMIGVYKEITEKSCKKAGVAPRSLTREKSRELKIFSERTLVNMFGGFSAFMEAAFPAEVEPKSNPLEDLDLASGFELSEQIKNAIQDCANELDMEPSDVSFARFKHYCNIRYGQNDKGLARFGISDAGGYAGVRDAYFPPKATKQAVSRFRVQEHAAMNRRLGKEAIKLQYTLERLEEFSERCFAGRISPIKHPKKNHIERILNALISDTHLGSDIDKEETGACTYGKTEEARRMAYIVKQISNYKREHRENTVLHLYLAGDLYDGVLHDQREGALLSEQMARTFHIFSQVIAHLAAEFPEVKVFCTPGNHERFTSRHPKRATFQKTDSGVNVIYLNLRTAFKKFDNVEFIIPKTPYICVPLFDKKAFVTHGDTVFNSGNVSKTISISALENQTNRINASLKDTDKYDVFLCGHVHSATFKPLDNGSTVIINGALCPVNPYAVSLGILESNCGMMMFESVPGHAVGDLRYIQVNEETDKDVSLDEIIQPWEEF